MSAGPIRVAVVGLGRSGWGIHIKRLRDDERFQIVAVADFAEDRRNEAREELGCAVYESHRAMIRESDSELVVVASYSFSHSRIAVEALDSGRHVLVEKPIAMNTQWVDRMIEARDSAQRRLFPFHNYRYMPEYRYLQNVINDGTIGDVFEIRMRGLGFSRRNDWQTLREYGGGVLNNTCPHFIDLLLQMLEAPVTEVFSDLKLVTNVGDAENHVRVIMRGENGRIADMLVSSVDAWPEPKWTLLGSRGTLVSDGKEAHIKSFAEGSLPPYRVSRGPSPGRSYDYGGTIDFTECVEQIETPVPHDLHDNIYAVLREGAEQDITVEDVREVVRITEQARQKAGFYGGVTRSFDPER